MSFIMSFGLGVGISFIIALPLIFWAKKIGKQAYISSRVRGMKGKLLEPDLLQDLTHVESLPELRDSKYWEIVHKSQDREIYEKKLEKLFYLKYEDLKNLSDSATKEFIETYFGLKNKINDIKLILYCVENNRDNEELKALLNNDDFISLFDYAQVSEIINHLKREQRWEFLDMKSFNRFGLPGLEYALDNYFYRQLKKKSKGDVLKTLYKRLRKDYLLQQILRLKKLGKNEREIIDLLNLKKKNELKLVKKDLNLVLKDLSEEDQKIRQMMIMGEENHKIFNYYFKNSLIKFTEKQEKLQGPFKIGSTFYILFRIRREIDAVKNLWVVS